MVGCRTIIAIDKHESRLQAARSLGATHVINTSGPALDLVAEVLKLTAGNGVHVSLDTTGVQGLARKSWDFVRCHGKILQVGLAKPGDMWNVSMADHMNSGKQIIGCVQGDAIPQEYIIRMIRWYREGKLPVDKLVSLYAVEEYEKALEDMRNGKSTKPVLVWPNGGPHLPHM
jgi:Zn-dependent alcohol dehydrogenase